MSDAYANSALRHSTDADLLAASGHWHGAGYLIGYAVECAIKSAIIATRPAAGAPHKHLPDLIERAKKSLQGRRKHSIFTVLEQVDFMRNWSVDIRYACDGRVDENQFRQWRMNANRALAAANLRRQR